MGVRDIYSLGYRGLTCVCVQTGYVVLCTPVHYRLTRALVRPLPPRSATVILLAYCHLASTRDHISFPTSGLDNVPRHSYLVTLPCTAESHPTPGDSRGSSSPSRSISGVSSQLLMVAPLEFHFRVFSHLCLGLPLLRAPFTLPSITSSFIPPALTTCPK